MAFDSKLTQICTVCQESKPFPAHYIVSYNKMEMTTQCKDCRNAKKRKQAKVRCGKTDKAASWKNSISKMFKY